MHKITQRQLIIQALDTVATDSTASVALVLDEAMRRNEAHVPPVFGGKTPRNSARRALYALLDAAHDGWQRGPRGQIERPEARPVADTPTPLY